mmetsp:Transcript_15451/g.39954  ORF Transcript_15451/g.39954 Transcript_15451/m.39954 type:complete len:499 (+) Transcript_15451:73-1569(+)
MAPPGTKDNGGSLLLVTAAIAGIGGALLGYDVGAIAVIINMDPFCAIFLPEGNGTCTPPPNQQQQFDTRQSLIVTTLVAGCAVGAIVSSKVADSPLGRRGTIQLACVLVCLGAAGQCLVRTYLLFNAARVVAGLGIGFSSALTPVYIAEVSEAGNRGMMVTFNQLSMTGGIALAFWVGWALQHAAHGWQWAIAAQCIPATFLFVGLLVLPASPRWLAQRGRTSKARATLIGLGRSSAAADDELEQISAAISAEATAGSLLSDPLLVKCVAISVALQSFQQLTGINVVMFYAPKIFTAIGIHNSELLATAGFGIINFLSTFIAFFFLDRVGRKTLLVVGGVIMALSMGTIGALGTAFYNDETEELKSTTAGWACIVAVYTFVAAFAFSWGPVVWLIPTELLPTSHRAKGVSISTTANWLWGIAVARFIPGLQDQLHFTLYLVFAGLAVVMSTFVAVAVPETKNKSLEEISVALGVASTKSAAGVSGEKQPLLVNATVEV